MFKLNLCYRDCTPEIIKELERIGYEPYRKRLFSPVNPNLIFISRYGFYCVGGLSLDGQVGRVCNTVEALLALAALSDETDKYQWFIYDDSDWNDSNPQRFWYQCESDKIEQELAYDLMYTSCTKATIEEILECFDNPFSPPNPETTIKSITIK